MSRMWHCEQCNIDLLSDNGARHLSTEKHRKNVIIYERERAKVLAGFDGRIRRNNNLPTPITPIPFQVKPKELSYEEKIELLKQTIENQKQEADEYEYLLKNIHLRDMQEIEKLNFETQSRHDKCHKTRLDNDKSLLFPYPFILLLEDKIQKQCEIAYNRYKTYKFQVCMTALFSEKFLDKFKLMRTLYTWLDKPIMINTQRIEHNIIIQIAEDISD